MPDDHYQQLWDFFSNLETPILKHLAITSKCYEIMFTQETPFVPVVIELMTHDANFIKFIEHLRTHMDQYGMDKDILRIVGGPSFRQETFFDISFKYSPFQGDVNHVNRFPVIIAKLLNMFYESKNTMLAPTLRLRKKLDIKEDDRQFICQDKDQFQQVVDKILSDWKALTRNENYTYDVDDKGDVIPIVKDDDTEDVSIISFNTLWETLKCDNVVNERNERNNIFTAENINTVVKGIPGFFNNVATVFGKSQQAAIANNQRNTGFRV